MTPHSVTAPPRLICMGEPMVEFNQQPDGRFLKGFGGDTSNAAIAAARQGAQVGFFTHLGDDRFGHDIVSLWRDEGIDSSLVQMRASVQTGIYFVTHDDDGHHFSYYRKDSASARITADDCPLAELSSAAILHVSGISQAISPSAADAVLAAVHAVRNRGGMVSYDTNLRLGLWPLEQARAIIHDTMRLCDIALPGYDDARLLTNCDRADDIADFYLGLGARIVALTLGQRGTFVALADERRLVPSWPVTAIDATAAGDTFDGAFLAEIMEGRDPFAAAAYANAAAALSTTGYGAVKPIPTRAEVSAFLAARQ